MHNTPALHGLRRVKFSSTKIAFMNNRHQHIIVVWWLNNQSVNRFSSASCTRRNVVNHILALEHHWQKVLIAEWVILVCKKNNLIEGIMLSQSYNLLLIKPILATKQICDHGFCHCSGQWYKLHTIAQIISLAVFKLGTTPSPLCDYRHMVDYLLQQN